MSTRAGNVIRLVDLMDEAVRRAREVVDAKSPELSEAERAAIAEAIERSGSKREAARRLGIDVATLIRKARED